jgi:hypothetical protein
MLLPTLFTTAVFVLGCLVLAASFYLGSLYTSLPEPNKLLDVAETKRLIHLQSRRRSWIVTGEIVQPYLSLDSLLTRQSGVASLVCTLGSAPYVLDFVNSRGNVALVQPRILLSHGLCAFFLSYLTSASRTFSITLSLFCAHDDDSGLCHRL